MPSFFENYMISIFRHRRAMQHICCRSSASSFPWRPTVMEPGMAFLHGMMRTDECHKKTRWKVRIVLERHICTMHNPVLNLEYELLFLYTNWPFSREWGKSHPPIYQPVKVEGPSFSTGRANQFSRPSCFNCRCNQSSLRLVMSNQTGDMTFATASDSRSVQVARWRILWVAGTLIIVETEHDSFNVHHLNRAHVRTPAEDTVYIYIYNAEPENDWF